jgi:hypothetical protein
LPEYTTGSATGGEPIPEYDDKMSDMLWGHLKGQTCSSCVDKDARITTLESERNTALTKVSEVSMENGELKARVRELEEAGDEAIFYIECLMTMYDRGGTRPSLKMENLLRRGEG